MSANANICYTFSGVQKQLTEAAGQKNLNEFVKALMNRKEFKAGGAAASGGRRLTGGTNNAAPGQAAATSSGVTLCDSGNSGSANAVDDKIIDGLTIVLQQLVLKRDLITSTKLALSIKALYDMRIFKKNMRPILQFFRYNGAKDVEALSAKVINLKGTERDAFWKQVGLAECNPGFYPYPKDYDAGIKDDMAFSHTQEQINTVAKFVIYMSGLKRGQFCQLSFTAFTTDDPEDANAQVYYITFKATRKEDGRIAIDVLHTYCPSAQFSAQEMKGIAIVGNDVPKANPNFREYNSTKQLTIPLDKWKRIFEEIANYGIGGEGSSGSAGGKSGKSTRISRALRAKLGVPANMPYANVRQYVLATLSKEQLAALARLPGGKSMSMSMSKTKAQLLDLILSS